MTRRRKDLDKFDLGIAMENSYNVIVRGFDPFIIINDGVGWFAHDPTDELLPVDVQGILYYFEDEDDFEKCIELKAIIDEL
tara:strand:+ start:9262 stop:9504 length:243 start_codon:yes stop_codon:yes gene_type:complete